MKLSTRSTYGLRAMLAIATDGGSGAVMIKDIAGRYQLPATYLEQIMGPLRKAGLLLATRGARGGYRLARPASDMTVCDIVEAVEGSLELVDCADITCCGMQPELCAVKDVLAGAGAAMRRALTQVSLAELVERQQMKQAVAAEMYVI